METSPMQTTRGPRFQIERHIQRLYRRNIKPTLDRLRGREIEPLSKAQALLPLMFAEKTYNASHPEYDAALVSNFPGWIFNPQLPCRNPLFLEIKKLAKGDQVPDQAWDEVLKRAMEEASAVPGYGQVMERVAFIEKYLAKLGRRHGAHYIAGWVNLVDAYFLYWA